MNWGRRTFLTATGLALASGGVLVAVEPGKEAAKKRPAAPATNRGETDWDAVRREFALSESAIHMSALFIASHPRVVREAIEGHRAALDADPLTYLQDNNHRLRRETRRAAAKYLGVDGSDIVLTDSTTMGLGLVYGGLRLEAGAEMLSTEEDYYVTHEAIRLSAQRNGASVRKISLGERGAAPSEDEVVARIAGAVGPATRVLALTWVHSSSGLKLPTRRIAERLREINADRDPAARVLFCLDGVHGFGCEDASFKDIGCDVLMTGCHKWLFGPRGTGIVVAKPEALKALIPTIPSFIDDEAWSAWREGRQPDRPVDADAMTPGGFKAFEHQWALAEAFRFHEEIGRERIAARTQALAAQLKDGLAKIVQVTLHTPRDTRLSAGIVAFDVEGRSPWSVVEHLRERGIVASVTPYARRHVRLTPSIYNTPSEVETCLREIHQLAS
jgi:isopenicillin-N epimerase